LSLTQYQGANGTAGRDEVLGLRATSRMRCKPLVR
jgi:hypothetical protein